MPNPDEGYTRITIDKICDEGCINVLKSFGKYIGTEYTTALKAYCDEPDNKTFEARYNDIKKFVLSKYFARLTNLEGEVVIQTLERNYLNA